MSHRSIGQERFGFAGRGCSGSSLDELGKLIDWDSVSELLNPLYSATKRRARLAANRDVQGTASLDLV